MPSVASAPKSLRLFGEPLAPRRGAFKVNVREMIVERLERLREYVSYLKEYRKHSLEEISKDPTLRGAIERYLQLSAEVVIDSYCRAKKHPCS